MARTRCGQLALSGAMASMMALTALTPMTARAAGDGEHQETRVQALVGKCPVSQGASVELAPLVLGLLTAVAPAVIEKAIDLAGTAATLAGQDTTVKSAVSSVQGNFYASRDGSLFLNKSLGCIVIARGRFRDDSRDPAEGWVKANMGVLARAMGMQGNPGFYMEITLEVSLDRTAFRLVPQYLYLGEPMEVSAWRSNARGLSISLSFSNAGADKAFASSILAFPELMPPFEAGTRYLQGYRSNWMPLPAPSERTIYLTKEETDYQAQIKKAIEDLALVAPPRPRDAADAALLQEQQRLCDLLKEDKKEDPSCPRSIALQKELLTNLAKSQTDKDTRWANQQAKDKLDQWNAQHVASRNAAYEGKTVWLLDNLQPFNLDVTTTETQAGSKLLKFVGDVLTAAKPAVKELATDKLAEYSAQSKASAQKASDTAYLAAIEAKTAVERQLLKVAQATTDDDRNTASVELPKLKLAANIAYRAAGLPEPYAGVTP